MSKTYKNCQSCGMPLNKDENGGGTESNGKKSTLYCSHCYVNGEFTRPDITVDEMKELVIGKLVEMKFPMFMAKFFARGIHKLERWNN